MKNVIILTLVLFGICFSENEFSEDDLKGLTEEEKQIMQTKAKPESKKSTVKILSNIVGYGFITWGLYDSFSRLNGAYVYNDQCKSEYVECDGLGKTFYFGFAVDLGLVILGIQALKLD